LSLANNGRPRGNGSMRHDTIKGAPNLLATVLFSFLMRSGTVKCEVGLLVLSFSSKSVANGHRRVL
jgi:hypothetical protein